MRLDLAERLRCPRAHESTPLIVVALRVEDRALRSGVAGCAVCHLEARIAMGEVRFPDADASAPRASLVATPERVQRTAALLGLDEPGGTVLLSGRYASLAVPLAAEYGVLAVIVGGAELPPGPGGSVVVVHAPAGAVPFTDHTFRAAAVDAAIDDAVRTLMVGGRLLAPLPLALPAAIKELARDEEEWVAVREAGVSRVELKRSRGT